ncbi:MAG: hemerythrin domain-containing protein [Actinomycetota bacterium]
MSTIFEALTTDHDRQRALADELLQTVGDSDDRRRLFDELQAELTAHAKHEERHFYVPLLEHDLTQEKARHSVAEHKELDDYVEQLETYDRSAPQWLQTAEQLVDRLRHHLEEEEREVFQLAGKALTDGEKTTLAEHYIDAMADERATT